MTDADLANCEREPIQFLGNVQSFGCLISVSANWEIKHVSANVGEILGLECERLIGASFADCFPRDSVHLLRTKMQILARDTGVARVFDLDIFEDGRRFDISIHISGRCYGFEFERKRDESSLDQVIYVQPLLARIKAHETVEDVTKEAARALQTMTGFDRVMIYRFEDDASGTVLAEYCEPGMDSYLGLRFPAGDIPRQARELYKKSLLRLIADVDAPVYPIIPPGDVGGTPLDLSLAVTRAVSPIHLEYLRNMGVVASMSVSILRKGQLWGLFACHNRTPLYIDYEKRTAVELFAQMFSYELAQIAHDGELAEIDRAQGLHDTLASQLSAGADLPANFDVIYDEIDRALRFDGAVLYSQGKYMARGSVPSKDEFQGLTGVLQSCDANSVFATNALSEHYEPATRFADRAAGMLVVPISAEPRDYLVLFRREVTQSVTWAGKPEKLVHRESGSERLSPRKSFAAWQQIMRGKSTSWTSHEKRTANALRATFQDALSKASEQSTAGGKQASQHQEILIAELNHRVRNILNLIRGLVSQGRGDATSIEEYTSSLDARIHSLARAHDQLTQQQWNWAPIWTLIDTEVKAFVSADTDRVRVTGDNVLLSPEAFTTLALVFHELVTNSAKYGALSDRSGSIDVVLKHGADGVLKIDWSERGGPPVMPPKRQGFGTTIIAKSIPFELHGKATLNYQSEGVQAAFEIPSNYVQSAGPAANIHDVIASDDEGGASLSGEVLVVEDNLIVAMDVSDMLTDLGADTVHSTGSVTEAMRILSEHPINLALLDVNLGQETSLSVAQRLHAAQIPFLLTTGYGESKGILEEYPAAPVLKKPYVATGLRQALSKLTDPVKIR